MWRIFGDVILDASHGRYRAFISYSHRDTAWCKRIHRDLETYRIPKALVGTNTARGIVPGRLSPIFRDREELSIGDDLSQLVQDALSASDALIVLCSPNAKSSLWVNKEIETFRTLHPDRPVFAAIVDGEPEAAFPPAFTAGGAREPVAADFREQGDGRKLALMKLVSGLAGVGLDALVRRDAQRQRRRVIAVTLGAGSIMLILSGLLVMAMRAQAEAERQRAGAEGLVEYMLTDLRDRLKGVGRLDVMTAVNERAMGYYRGQGDLLSLPDASLDRRARILLAMGEDDQKRGNQEKARAKFAEAHRTTAAALQKQPRSADALFAHGQSEFWMGAVAWAKDDRPGATRHWQAYLKQANALAAAEPDSVRAAMERGYAHGNLCDLYSYKDFDLAAAARNCRASIQFEEAALKKAPDERKILESLSNRYGWMALVHLQLGEPANALVARDRENLILAQLLSGDPQNREYQYRAQSSVIGKSVALIAMGRAQPAESLLRATRIQSEKLAAVDRDDMRAQESHALVLVTLAEAATKFAKAPARADIAGAQQFLISLEARQRVDRSFTDPLKTLLTELEQEEDDD